MACFLIVDKVKKCIYLGKRDISQILVKFHSLNNWQETLMKNKKTKMKTFLQNLMLRLNCLLNHPYLMNNIKSFNSHVHIYFISTNFFWLKNSSMINFRILGAFQKRKKIRIINKTFQSNSFNNLISTNIQKKSCIQT